MNILLSIDATSKAPRSFEDRISLKYLTLTPFKYLQQHKK